uniref:Borealin-2-like n=1 Tax=Gouania willdenowi TaxID=441366 RepID=A0A8C5NHT4_GOUWI
MPTKRARNVVKGQNKEQSSLGMRRSKLALFIQQFEKEAQERVKDLEAKFDNMLATVDRAFTVELMKKPPALQNTRLGDLINGEKVFNPQTKRHLSRTCALGYYGGRGSVGAGLTSIQSKSIALVLTLWLRQWRMCINYPGSLREVLDLAENVEAEI